MPKAPPERGDDKSVDFQIAFERLPIAEWLPVSWKEHVEGEASGRIEWRGPNPKLEKSEGESDLARGRRTRR